VLLRFSAPTTVSTTVVKGFTFLANSVCRGAGFAACTTNKLCLHGEYVDPEINKQNVIPSTPREDV
jgi:hypothetical protein